MPSTMPPSGFFVGVVKMTQEEFESPRITKKRRKEIARELILGHHVMQRFSQLDAAHFGDLCGYEFEWVQRASRKLGSAAVVYVSWPGGDYIGSWSWVRSINGYDDRHNLLSAMRVASKCGTFQSVSPSICLHCGRVDRLTVDHRSVPFSRIADLFISEHGEPEIVNVNFGWQLVDPNRFLDHHDRLADYQVLCISCNAKKGVKNDARTI